MAYETQDGVPTLSDPNTPGGGGPVSSAIEILDEGLAVGTASKLNIVGKDIQAVYMPAFNRVDIVQTRGDFVQVEAGRDKFVVNNSYLTGADGIFMNLSPFVVPFDGIIDAVILSAASSSVWQVEVYKGANIINVPNQADSILTFGLNNQKFGLADGFSIPVGQGDSLAFYIRGNNVSFPRVNIFIKRT